MQNNYLNYYQPRQSMYQPQQQPQPMPQVFNYNMIKGFPVASIEEARAANIDFDGSVFIFPDLANHRIYTKNINQDGTLSFNTYEIVENDKNIGETTQKYVTRAQLEEALEQFRQELMGLYPQQEKKNPINVKF